MFGGTNNIIQNILHIQFECEEYSIAFPLNIVMDLNNVMEVGACVFFFFCLWQSWSSTLSLYPKSELLVITQDDVK